MYDLPVSQPVPFSYISLASVDQTSKSDVLEPVQQPPGREVAPPLLSADQTATSPSRVPPLSRISWEAFVSGEHRLKFASLSLDGLLGRLVILSCYWVIHSPDSPLSRTGNEPAAPKERLADRRLQYSAARIIQHAFRRYLV